MTLERTERGIPFATFTLAVTPRMRNASGQWSDAATSFHCGVVWRDRAQRVADSVHKGLLVAATTRGVRRGQRSLATLGRYVRISEAWMDNAATQLGF